VLTDHKDVDDYQHLYYGASMPSTAPKPTHENQALTGRWRVDPQASHARFVASTFAGLVNTPGRFRGLAGGLVVEGTRADGALVIDAASIDTGNGLRDRHLRSGEFFDVRRHPQLRYEVRSIALADEGSARIDGELLVAGARTALALDVAVRAPMDDVLELACSAEVDRVALGIRGARGMVPRAVELDVVVTLRRAHA
jgi:polyisoprenoid-binding protein YceI